MHRVYCVRKGGHTLQHCVQNYMAWLPSYVNKEIWWLKALCYITPLRAMLQEAGSAICYVKCCRNRTRFYSCHIACNISRNNCKGGHSVQYKDCAQYYILCPVLKNKIISLLISPSHVLVYSKKCQHLLLGQTENAALFRLSNCIVESIIARDYSALCSELICHR